MAINIGILYMTKIDKIVIKTYSFCHQSSKWTKRLKTRLKKD